MCREIQRASEIKGERGKKHQFFNYLKVHGEKETKYSIWKSDAIKIKKLFTTYLDTAVEKKRKK